MIQIFGLPWHQKWKNQLLFHVFNHYIPVLQIVCEDFSSFSLLCICFSFSRKIFGQWSFFLPLVLEGLIHGNIRLFRWGEYDFRNSFYFQNVSNLVGLRLIYKMLNGFKNFLATLLFERFLCLLYCTRDSILRNIICICFNLFIKFC